MDTPVNVLLVEDNPVDVLLTRHALKGSSVPIHLLVAEDGEEALNLLHGRCKERTGGPCPDFILLDLNLPKRSGKEVLAEIKQNDFLKHLPVVILTTSDAEEDVLGTYQLHANCFITKPVDMEKFNNVLKCLGEFWFALAKLPTPPGS